MKFELQEKIIFAGFIGFIIGGIFALVSTKAIPRMMTKMSANMMENMARQMELEGCDPSEY